VVVVDVCLHVHDDLFLLPRRRAVPARIAAVERMADAGRGLISGPAARQL
jgi:hypothetical protein